MKPRQLVVLDCEITTWTKRNARIKIETRITITMGAKGMNGLPDVPSHRVIMYADKRGMLTEYFTPGETARES